RSGFLSKRAKVELRTSSKTVSIATLHQPTSPYLRPPSPGGRGNAQRRMRGGAGPRPVPPLTRPSAPPSRGGGCRAAADEGGAGPRPVPPLTRPSATLSRREKVPRSGG